MRLAEQQLAFQLVTKPTMLKPHSKFLHINCLHDTHKGVSGSIVSNHWLVHEQLQGSRIRAWDTRRSEDCEMQERSELVLTDLHGRFVEGSVTIIILQQTIGSMLNPAEQPLLQAVCHQRGCI